MVTDHKKCRVEVCRSARCREGGCVGTDWAAWALGSGQWAQWALGSGHWALWAVGTGQWAQWALGSGKLGTGKTAVALSPK